VEAVSSGITVRPHERLNTITVREGSYREQQLEEDSRNSNGVSRWAISSINAIGVSHVRFVIGTIQIDSIPAHREEDLSSEAIAAGVVVCGEVVGLSGRSGSARSGQTCIGDGSVFERSRVVSAHGVSGQHSQTLGDGLPVGIGLISTTSSRQIVDSQATIGHQRKGSIVPLVVKVWMPISRQVDLADGASGARRRVHILKDLQRSLVDSCSRKVIATRDFVSMACNFARIDNGIDTTSEQGLT